MVKRNEMKWFRLVVPHFSLIPSGVLSLVRCRFVTIGSWERGITSGGWLALRCSIPAVPPNSGE